MKQYKGEKHSKWKGGKILMSNGYMLIYSPNHPNKLKTGKGYVLEHRLIMEKKLNRFLDKKEIVHHINGIRNDNRIENLVITNQNKHIAKHNKERIWKKTSKKKKSEQATKAPRNNKGQFINVK